MTGKIRLTEATDKIEKTLESDKTEKPEKRETIETTEKTGKTEETKETETARRKTTTLEARCICIRLSWVSFKCDARFYLLPPVSLSHTRSLSRSLFLCLSLALSFSVSLSHTRSLSRALSLCRVCSRTLPLSFYLCES